MAVKQVNVIMQKSSEEAIHECLLCCIERNAWMGRINIIPTIIIGNIEIELPAIHIMNKFIGNCFRGPSAMSQDFYNRNENRQSNKDQRSIPPRSAQ